MAWPKRPSLSKQSIHNKPLEMLFIEQFVIFQFIVYFAHSVTLQAGAHLDLNVVVMVQKAFTDDDCQEFMEQQQPIFDDKNENCLRLKCSQSIQYKVDLGYSNVRKTVNGRRMEYPGGTRQYLKRKNQLSLELAKKARQMNNDAFQPFLFTEFERLITEFYDGHARILTAFNISMDDLINEQLPLTMNINSTASPCTELPAFMETRRELVEILKRNWQINWTRHDENVTDITFFEVIKQRLPPSPIQMIEAYSIQSQKQALVDHVNELFHLLVRLSNQSQRLRPLMNGTCLRLLEEIDKIVKTEPLISRLHYSPVRSLFIRNVEAMLNTKAARGQHGRYYDNNMATLRFRFMSMTAIRMEESREYNNFNLFVDLGSTLGLYFGLTLLTLFELAIFILYRAGSRDPLEVSPAPAQSIIYNIPINPNASGLKVPNVSKLVRRRGPGKDGKKKKANANDLMRNSLFPPLPLPS